MLLSLFIACGLPTELVVSIGDQHNFDFSADLQAESTDILGQTDAVLSWDNLTVDLLGRSILPEADIHKIAILHFPRLSEAQVLVGIDHETLKQSDLNAYVELETEVGQTQAMLTDFSMQGVFVDPSEHLPSDSGTYLLTFTSEEESTLSLAFFSPEMAGGDRIDVHSESALLEAEVDLLSMEIADVGPAERHVVDWSGLTRSGTGRPLSLSSIDRFILAGFNEDLSTLEGSFFELSDLAVMEFHAEVMGRTAVDLSDLVAVDGEVFSSFEGADTWLMFLKCSLCVNPSPLFVGALGIDSL